MTRTSLHITSLGEVTLRGRMVSLCHPQTLRCCCQQRNFGTSARSRAPAQPGAQGSALSSPELIQREVISIVSKRDYPSYLASYFYPRHLQQHYLALRAFNAEVASVKEAVSNEILGRIRIGWWRDAIRMAFDEKRKTPPKHPVVIALRNAIWDEEVRKHGGLVEDHFQRIIQAREDDLASPLTPPTLEDLETYGEATSSRLFYLTLNLLGVDSRAADELFSHLGKASGLALLLASVPFHAGFTRPPQQPKLAPGQDTPPQPSRQQRRLMLPHEYLLEHKVIEEDVYRNAGNARGLKDAVFATATRANDYLITARTLIKDEFQGKVPASLIGPLVGAVPARFYLEQLEKHDFDPFQPALQGAAAGRDLWLTWAAWRASRKGNI